MKKGWKTFWIVSLIIFCIGVGFCIAGTALGATWEMVANHTPGWISFGNGADHEVAISGTKAEKVSANALEQTFTGIHSIKVDAELVELQILTTEDNDGITVKFDDEKFASKVNCYKEGSELIVKSNSKIEINDVAETIWIYIPENSLRNVDIDVQAGTIYIENLIANSLDVNVEAGEAVIQQFKVQEAEFECGAGRIEAFGNVERDLDASCGAGEILLSLNGKKEDYNYEVECGIGEVLIGDESHSGIGTTDRHSHGASKEMNIECGIGSVTVEFE